MSDFGTRTKVRQTRLQWLDAHEVHDPAIREETLKNFETRDDIQAYLSAMRKSPYAKCTLSAESALSLPHLLEVSADVLASWRRTIDDSLLIGALREAEKGRDAKLFALKTTLHLYLDAGVPPEYLVKNRAALFGWTDADIASAWTKGVSHEDLGTYLSAIAVREREDEKKKWFRRAKRQTREETLERSRRESMSAVAFLCAAGIPGKYLSALPEAVSLDEATRLYRSGADAKIVSSRLDANPEMTVKDILSEVDALTSEYWNLIN